jgi:putative transcriptional regulator
MSNVKYIVYTTYNPKMQFNIEVRIDDLLKKHGRSFYWLSKETGVSHTTLWRLKKGKALGINFATLEKICHALECEPGDVVKFRDKGAADRNSKIKNSPAGKAKRAAA